MKKNSLQHLFKAPFSNVQTLGSLRDMTDPVLSVDASLTTEDQLNKTRTL